MSPKRLVYHSAIALKFDVIITTCPMRKTGAGSSGVRIGSLMRSFRVGVLSRGGDMRVAKLRSVVKPWMRST